jgi:hypothetical protein
MEKDQLDNILGQLKTDNARAYLIPCLYEVIDPSIRDGYLAGSLLHLEKIGVGDAVKYAFMCGFEELEQRFSRSGIRDARDEAKQFDERFSPLLQFVRNEYEDTAWKACRGGAFDKGIALYTKIGNKLAASKEAQNNQQPGLHDELLVQYFSENDSHIDGIVFDVGYQLIKFKQESLDHILQHPEIIATLITRLLNFDKCAPAMQLALTTPNYGPVVEVAEKLTDHFENHGQFDDAERVALHYGMRERVQFHEEFVPILRRLVDEEREEDRKQGRLPHGVNPPFYDGLNAKSLLEGHPL